MPPTEIWISREGSSCGPYTEQEVDKMVADGLAFPDDWAWSEDAQTWVPLKDLLSQKAGADPASAATQPSAATPLPSGFRPLPQSLRERATLTPARGPSEQTPARDIVKRPNYVHEAEAYEREAEKAGFQAREHQVSEDSDAEQIWEITALFLKVGVTLAAVAAVVHFPSLYFGETFGQLVTGAILLMAGVFGMYRWRLR